MDTDDWGQLQVGRSGAMCAQRSSVGVAAPKSMEDLRRPLLLLGHHFIFLKVRCPSRKLASLIPFTFMVYAQVLLGEQVAELEAADGQTGALVHKPSVLQ